MQEIKKPFDVTKAVDFTDPEIDATWVDLARENGFLRLVDPRASMPVVILGGKGSGRTHLLRYYSYSLQKIRAERAKKSLVEHLRSEGYIGIYMRCEGLNAGRFEGKGQSAEAWLDIFAHYMDLWIAQLTLGILSDAYSACLRIKNTELRIAEEIKKLFTEPNFPNGKNLQEICDHIAAMRNKLDRAVNNAALTRSLEGTKIGATRARLVFGIPQIFATHLPAFKSVQVSYLIDELENLLEPQQQYVNTLIRERQSPSSIIVGSRSYGFRTLRTMSAGEENRAGSEFERIFLDEQLRTDDRYDDFARKIVTQRLRNAGLQFEATSDKPNWKDLDRFFEEFGASRFEILQTRFVEKYENLERPWLVKLGDKLRTAIKRDHAPGLDDIDDAMKVVSILSCAEFPLLEKVNTFLFYQDWSIRKNLMRSAREIAASCKRTISGSRSERHEKVLGHFKGDLLAQMLREGRQHQRYLGLETFIDMSSGIPRHLLIVLKYVHRWAVFNGESAFEGNPISMAAQRRGVLQASNWFFDDAISVGTDPKRVQSSVDRLAGLLRRLRYSDKPVESSLTMFSFKELEASPYAAETIRQATDSSLLLRVIAGSKDRNDEGVIARYQLNPMLCPRYDLPTSRRGHIVLTRREIEAIFGEAQHDYKRVVTDRLTRMVAPFRIRRRRVARSVQRSQQDLPGLE